MPLIDSHCHLQLPDYDSDREAVLARMREHGVGAIVVGTTAKTSAAAISLAEQNDNVWAAVGHHPEHLTSSHPFPGEEDAGRYDIAAIERLVRSSSKVVAIGETGLDFYRIDKDRDVAEARHAQETAFREHLALAIELDLPVIIHCREALTRLAELVQKENAAHAQIRGVVHCFTGTWEEAKPLLDLGLYLSFTGLVTFPPRKSDDPERHVHRVIERMPFERLLIETDAPFLAPVPHRGERNEPLYVEFVAEQAAKLRGVSFDEVASSAVENTERLFGKIFSSH